MSHLVILPVLAVISFLPQNPSAHPINKEKALAWAKSVETTITAGDPSVLNSTLSGDGLIRRVGLCISPELRKQMDEDGWSEFSMGIRESLSKANFGSRIARVTTQNGEGYFSFLRLMPYRGRTIALFRLHKDDGLNYYKFFLEEDKNGDIVFSDMYVYLAGETTSKSVCRMASLDLNQKLGLFDKLVGKERERMTGFQKVLELMSLSRGGQFQKVIELYNSLPKSVQDDKIVQIFRYTSAMNLDPKTYHEVSVDILNRFESDPSLYLLLLDGFVNTEKYEDALRCLQGLEKDLGGDPYLDSFRGQIYRKMGQYDKAVEASRRLLKDPTFALDAYATLVDTYVTKGDYPKAIEILKEAKAEAEIEFNLSSLADDPEYSGLIKSEVYKEYMATQEEGAAEE